MAITKTHTIKATVNLAIDYICDPEKTDGQLLISSYGCSPETADIEFEMTRDKSYSKRGTVLARHLIQSFEPNETTPEIAHEIGKRLADEVLQGKYEYVLSTHIDKGHIHNHIIFNAVSFTDFKKYHSNKRSYRETRAISDKLCAEYGLSVIEPNENKGKSYAEHAADKNGGSWKTQLRKAIDLNITQAKDFDDFIRLMELSGYTVKQQNKNISFCSDGRTKYMRSKTLGDDYTIDRIIDRISGGAKAKPVKDDKGIKLLIDIQNSVNAQKGKGFEHWAKLNNLKQSAKTLNYITQHNISSYADLEERADKAQKEFAALSAEIKAVEKEIATTALAIKSVQTYSKLKPIYTEYKKAKNKAEFREQHRAEITLFESAYNELKALDFPQIADLKKSYKKLTTQKTKLYADYRAKRAEKTELDTVKANIDSLLKDIPTKSRKKSKELE